MWTKRKFDACQDDLAKIGKSTMAMGAALNGTGIVFACSWGAKGGAPADMLRAGCNLWRSWHDIQAKKGWSEIPRISDHWAESTEAFSPFSGPTSAGKGYFDPDQLVGGDQQYSLSEARSQLGLWVMMSAPLILVSDPQA